MEGTTQNRHCFSNTGFCNCQSKQKVLIESWWNNLWKCAMQTRHWFCNCNFATVTSPAWTCQIIFWSLDFVEKEVSMMTSWWTWWDVRIAVCQFIAWWIKLWKCTVQNRRCFATLMLQLSRCHLYWRNNLMQQFISNKNIYRWWSLDGIDEMFGQLYAKSFLDGSSYGHARCKTDAVFAHLILQLSRCHVGTCSSNENKAMITWSMHGC